MPDEYKPLEFPDECLYLWDWFVGMREQNGDDFSSHAMKSWFELQGIKPLPFEVQALSKVMMALNKSKEVTHGNSETRATGR